MINGFNYKSFEEAGQAVLHYLHAHLGFNLWMITRVEGKNWIILQCEDHGYNVKQGQVLNWTDTLCSQMVTETVPRIVPRSRDIPLYANAPINKQVNIEAYIGQPLLNEDGSLFGTLCAVDPQPQPESILQYAEMIELFAQLLSYILQTELRENEKIRQHERLEAEALRDSLTELYNRRAWNNLVTAEEDRCKRHGHPASILIVDLNNLKIVNDSLGHTSGVELIQKTASVLRASVRRKDLVARLGGDEFGILSIENDQEGALALFHRIQEAFKEAGIDAAIGVASRRPHHGLNKAAIAADKNMFEHKRSGKTKT